MNYQNLTKNPFTNDNKFKGYYIVNKKWLQEYKQYYNYDTLSASIEQNSFIQNAFKNKYFNFNDKLLTLMIKQLPKNLVDDFNIRDKNISNFNNKEQKYQYTRIITYAPNKDLVYYCDFELINEELYDYLFKPNNMPYQNNIQDKAEKVECLFDQNYLLIKFCNPNSENKYLLEIGNLIQK